MSEPDYALASTEIELVPHSQEGGAEQVECGEDQGSHMDRLRRILSEAPERGEASEELLRWASTYNDDREGDALADALHSGGCSLTGRQLVLLCALCSSLTSVLLGYDVGVMSGAKEYMRPDLGLTGGETEAAVGCLNISAALGAAVAGTLADPLGRRAAIAIACIIFMIGTGACVAANGIYLLLAGRIITGLGVGCAMVIAPIYIAELAPADIRGALVSLTDISINLGILLGYAGSIACRPDWRLMIGLGLLPPALILICLKGLPESPRWLVSKGRQTEALVVLRRVSGSVTEAVDSLAHIVDSVNHHAKTSSWIDVLKPKDRAVRSAVCIGVGLGFWQQASGSEAAVYYGPEVLAQSGWSADQLLLGNVAIGFFKLFGEIIAFFLLDRVGRRPLLICSAGSMTIILLALSIATSASSIDGWTLLCLLCTFMFMFSIGLGPVSFVCASEIMPLQIRSKGMALVITVNRLMSGTIATSFISLQTYLTTSGAFATFACLSAASVVFYAVCVPETCGRTLEEISEGFDARAAAEEASSPSVNRARSPSVNRARSPYVNCGSGGREKRSTVREDSAALHQVHPEMALT